jgi:predicted nucleic-acid-binding Zn-ribbon protein
MAQENRCPKCNGVMDEGFVLDRTYGGKSPTVWVEGESETSFLAGLMIGNRAVFKVQAFRCTDCYYLEFYSTEKVEI